jgi:hypothetical protein
MTLFVEKSPSGSKSDFYFGINLDRIDIILNSKFIQKLSIHNFFILTSKLVSSILMT